MQHPTRIITLLALSGAMLSIMPAAGADTHTAKTKTSAKAAKTSEAHHPAAKDENEAEPDIQSSKNVEYHCELGNSLTMYHNLDDEQTLAMRWKKKLYRLTRVGTTTGALRFENPVAGLVWIGIPAKSLLLDSHKGQQLANECKPVVAALAETEKNSDEVQAK